MATETEERLAALEKRIEEFEAMFSRLMLLAANHPVGRKVLKFMAEANK